MTMSWWNCLMLLKGDAHLFVKSDVNVTQSFVVRGVIGRQSWGDGRCPGLRRQFGQTGQDTVTEQSGAVCPSTGSRESCCCCCCFKCIKKKDCFVSSSFPVESQSFSLGLFLSCDFINTSQSDIYWVWGAVRWVLCLLHTPNWFSKRLSANSINYILLRDRWVYWALIL